MHSIRRQELCGHGEGVNQRYAGEATIEGSLNLAQRGGEVIVFDGRDIVVILRGL
jgi:hypothetical protein